MENSPSSTILSLSSRLFPSDTTTTPSLQQPRKSVRSVRFSDEVSAKKTISRHSMTKQEKNNCSLQRRKSVRSVRFLNEVSVRKTISRHSMTQQEKTNYWLQEYEFLMIKHRNHIIIKQIHQERIMQKIDELYDDHHSSNNNNNNNNNNKNESSLCFRGLESGLESESLRKLTIRFGAKEVVFLEQEEQYSGDYYDDEAIACAYYIASSGCQFRAELIALQDRKEIEDYIIHDDYETI
jgi:hypothetical protein